MIGWSPTAFTSTMTDEYLVSVVGELLRRALEPGFETPEGDIGPLALKRSGVLGQRTMDQGAGRSWQPGHQ